jgi:uncharacterized membrane protein
MKVYLGKGLHPLKLLLGLLFFVLGSAELIDGVLDIADFVALLLLALLLRDIILSYTKGVFINEGECPLVSSKKNNYLKYGMSAFFLFMGLLGISLNNVYFFPDFQNIITKIVCITWSVLFLAISILKLKRGELFQRLIFCNVAIVLVLGSFNLT